MDKNPLSLKHSKALLLSLLCVLCAYPLRAQALWSEANVNIPVSDKWEMSFGGQYRTTDKFKETQRIAALASVSFKPLKFLSLETGFEFQCRHIASKETPSVIIPSFWNTYNRVHLSVSLSWRFQSIILSLRERYAVTHRSGKTITIEDIDGVRYGKHHIASNRGQLIRSRVQLRWDNLRFPVDPFFNAEIFEDIGSDCYIDRIRYTFGLNIEINDHNSLKPYYRFIDNFDGTSDSNIIGITYDYTF